MLIYLSCAGKVVFDLQSRLKKIVTKCGNCIYSSVENVTSTLPCDCDDVQTSSSSSDDDNLFSDLVDKSFCTSSENGQTGN